MKISVLKSRQQKMLVKLFQLIVETGDYEIGDDLLIISRRLQAKQLDAPIWAGRIGFNAVYAISGTLTRTE